MPEEFEDNDYEDDVDNTKDDDQNNPCDVCFRGLTTAACNM